MKPYISKIEKGELGDVAGLSKDFEWDDIGMFSVITGRNGSGKTKLLQSIEKKYKTRIILRSIDAKYSVPLIKHAQQILGNKPASLRFGDQGSYEINEPNGEKRAWQNSVDDINNSIVAKMDFSLLNSIIKKRRDRSTDYEKKELKRVEKYEQTYDIKDLLPSDEKDFEPWDEIDNFFNDFDLKVRIRRRELNAEISFYRRVEDAGKITEVGIDTSDLSSGEQLAFALSLWSWGSKEGERSQVLLIDEFDAHLNPCLMKKFIDAIKKFFVAKGVQVIMTTHSPTTVQYASQSYLDDRGVEQNGAKIIWMDNGEIVDDKDHQDVIRDLSSGLITVDDFIGDLRTLIDDATNKNILYTEGKTDPVYLESAVKILGSNFQEKFKEIELFGCVDDLRMIQFIELSIGGKKAALFDQFSSSHNGQKRKDRIDDAIKNYNSRNKNNPVKVVNIPNGFSEIECLFGEEFLKSPSKKFPQEFQKQAKHWDEITRKFKGDKWVFSAKMKKIVDEAMASNDNEKIAAAKEIFKNFESLLNQILQAFETKKS